MVLTDPLGLPPDYETLLEEIKHNIRTARTKAALSLNRSLISLYWDIGKAIVERQRKEGWGKSIVEKLSADIQMAFPGVSGFSPLNIRRMRAFYLAWTEDVKELSQLVTEIPWGHNIALIQKIKNPVKRIWYARQILEHGWSRSVLIHHMESRLYESDVA